MNVAAQLVNCSLEINHIGTEREIALQKLNDSIRELSKSLGMKFGEILDETTKIIMNFGITLKNALDDMFEPLSRDQDFLFLLSVLKTNSL